MTRICRVVALGVALVSAAACRQNEVAGSAPPPIEIRATLRPAQSVTVSAEVDGRVESVPVSEGATIAATASLAILSNPAIERDAVATRAQLDWIDARLARASGRQAPVRATPRDGIEIAEKILELRRQRFEKMKVLRRSNDITARELEQSEIEYLAALRDFNNERRVFAGVPASVDDTELLRIERRKVAADEALARERLSLLHIESPIGGTVSRLSVVPGQLVHPRDVIAEVSDVGTIHVRGEIAPELLRYVKPGMRVEVRVLGVPARTFADTIERIIPVQESGSRGAVVVVALPNPDRSLQPNTDALITVRSLK
jgi:multidrug efflux pump subunit AcrA (membrane-fusion protein)